eukprot:TRINITY_DN111115_c0_g1_i1.p1 TRINITY_DN111115_c0_g1~~TRINITY_DN111115_c0_g1_i1.p1  ORF type:complete len:177 (+),score=24.16 TRINITY_DN111115_c0_g1_i1:63-593(+)
MSVPTLFLFTVSLLIGIISGEDYPDLLPPENSTGNVTEDPTFTVLVNNKTLKEHGKNCFEISQGEIVNVTVQGENTSSVVAYSQDAGCEFQGDSKIYSWGTRGTHPINLHDEIQMHEIHVVRFDFNFDEEEWWAHGECHPDFHPNMDTAKETYTFSVVRTDRGSKCPDKVQKVDEL